jgi:NAD(P)-dependent dehydrogenase (short-subunit alcohol dehydrogenase family)
MPSPPSAQVFHMFGNDRRVSRDRRAPSSTPGELLSGRVVLVTGSGRGLGRELALGFAAQGATVIVNSFHSRDAGDATCADIVQAGGKAIHLWGSIANEAHVTRIFDEIGRRYGRLDALIANASDGYIGPFENLTSEHLEKGFKTNVVGLHACATAAAKLMTGGGQIVSLSTITSNRYLKDFTCQGVLKAAVETMTKYLAVELGGRGIRVNCVSAGPVYGDLITRFPDAQERIGHWESITPTGTLTRPDELARFIAFLISGTVPSANGATFTFDGGLSLGIDADVTEREGAASGIENLG